MNRNNLYFTISIFIISLFFVQCGGKYEPDIYPVKEDNAPISKERQVTNKKNRALNVDMYKVDKEPSDPDSLEEIYQKGIASWYGGKFQGRRTANGEVYDKYKLTAAHKTLPFNSLVEVINNEKDRKVIVRINDRGPFVKGRIIDLSKKAANMIGMEKTGTAAVSIRVLNKEALNKSHKAVVFSNLSKSKQTTPDNTVSRSNFEQNNPEPAQWFYIQAGAFQDRINAERVLDKIKRVTNVNFLIKKNNGFYKVVSVKLSPRSFAEKISADLKEYYIDTFVKSF